MEKTTTQRIIGILVVIALVIILLPLLFDKNDATAKVAEAKVPPLTPATTTTESPTTVAETNQTTSPTFIDIPPEVADQINQSSTIEPSSATTQPIATAPDATPAPSAKAAEAAPATVTQQPAAPAPGEPLTTPDQAQAGTEHSDMSVISTDSKPVVEKIIKAVDTQHTVTSTKHSKHVMKIASALKSKKTAWAVQLGSFKNKENAHRLADKLRASGYKAFTHEVRSASRGLQTRVYIGPEYQQASAAKLSSQVEQSLNLHGFVIPYKPLDL